MQLEKAQPAGGGSWSQMGSIDNKNSRTKKETQEAGEYLGCGIR